jgi:hypothetical protein
MPHRGNHRLDAMRIFDGRLLTNNSNDSWHTLIGIHRRHRFFVFNHPDRPFDQRPIIV